MKFSPNRNFSNNWMSENETFKKMFNGIKPFENILSRIKK